MSIQYENRSETNQSDAGSGNATSGASTSRANSTTDSTGARTGGGAGAQEARASSLNWGSARSDYGERAYGGSLDKKGLGGLGVDDYDEGRERGQSRGESGARSKGRSSRSYGSAGGAGNTGLTLLAGIGIGAALMYIFDPEQGRRRRALLRDQIVSCMNETSDVLGKTSRDLRNRAQGVIAEAGKALGRGQQGQNGGTSIAQASSQGAASASGQ